MLNEANRVLAVSTDTFTVQSEGRFLHLGTDIQQDFGGNSLAPVTFLTGVETENKRRRSLSGLSLASRDNISVCRSDSRLPPAEDIPALLRHRNETRM